MVAVDPVGVRGIKTRGNNYMGIPIWKPSHRKKQKNHCPTLDIRTYLGLEIILSLQESPVIIFYGRKTFSIAKHSPLLSLVHGESKTSQSAGHYRSGCCKEVNNNRSHRTPSRGYNNHSSVQTFDRNHGPIEKLNLVGVLGDLTGT